MKQNKICRKIIMASTIALSLFFLAGNVNAQEYIKDPNLKMSILRDLDKDSSYEITEKDLNSIEVINAPFSKIRSLKGLEKCKNLKIVELVGNEIYDASPLKSLKLDYVNISNQTPYYKIGDTEIKNPVKYIDGSFIPLTNGEKSISSESDLIGLGTEKNKVYSFSSGSFSGTITFEKTIPEQTKLKMSELGFTKEINGKNLEEIAKENRKNKEDIPKIAEEVRNKDSQKGIGMGNVLFYVGLLAIIAVGSLFGYDFYRKNKKGSKGHNAQVKAQYKNKKEGRR